MRVEALEGRALLSGVVSDVATLPAGVSAGPMAVAADGSLWYAQSDASHKASLARMTASGQKSELAVPSAVAGGTIEGVATDNFGNLWYTYAPPASDTSSIAVVGRVEPSGKIVEFPLATSADRIEGTAVGPDGQAWVALEPTTSGGLTTGAPALAKVAADGTLTRYNVTGASEVRSLTFGKDGNLWFVDGQRIGKSTTDGTVTFYNLTPPADGSAIDLSNAQLTAGPDGNIWFLGLGGLSKITPDGAVTTIASPQAKVTSLGTAGDGKIWFSFLPPAGTSLAAAPGAVLARMSPDGAVTILDDRADNAAVPVVRMVAGKDAGLWISEGSSAISRVNLASIPNFSPPIVRPTTAGTLSAIQGQPLAGVVATFVPNRADTNGLIYTSTIDWGDGHVTPATVKSDGHGGYIVEGSNTFTTTPGQTLQIKINLVDQTGATAIIFNQVTIQAPPTSMMTVPPRWRAFPAGSLRARAALAALAAVNSETPAGTTVPVASTPTTTTTSTTPTAAPTTTAASTTTGSTTTGSTNPATTSATSAASTAGTSSSPATTSGPTNVASSTTTTSTPSTSATTLTSTTSITRTTTVTPATAARIRQAAARARGGIHAQIVHAGAVNHPRGPLAAARLNRARAARR